MEIAFGVFGGLGLFLYGMNLMGMGLQKAAGERLKKLIEVLTNNRLMGVLVGALVTMIIQSSSATTVMVIGFVNAGLMTLNQAVGVIMGANVGTTITAQLIAFNLTDFAPIALGVGVGIWLFTSRKSAKDFAEILIGFGLLFMGMDLMGNSLAPLSENPAFKSIMISLNDPFLGVLVGLGLTTILQSSSASIGLLQALAREGLISLNIAFPILFGDNIGTTTTALLSSIGTNKTAKRAAIIHFLFNLIGTIIFMTLLRTPIQKVVLALTPGNIQKQIANAHTIFNILNVIIQFPFAGLLVKAANKLVPGDIEEEGVGLKFLDSRIIETPSIAVGQVSKEVSRMGKVVEKNLETSAKAFFSKDSKLIQEVFQQEKVINRLETDITEYLVELSNAPLTKEQHNAVNTLFNAVNDIERVGDHADNLAELAQYRMDHRLWFTDDAIDELKVMFDKVENVYISAVEAFKNTDFKKAEEVLKMEEEVDFMEKQYRANHIDRLNNLACQPSAGVIFLDLISNLERISDHSSNIAQYVLDKQNS
ncbi:Na/Pi cotransporter family protein [Anaerosalibacter bizertensis]|uniref:Na/Pi cotransporter family protein n=1 Tax=Anaerosalibacter bizertensis TaxID=932217 RepID=UPI003511E6A5